MLTTKAAHRKDTRSAPATFTHQHFRKVAEILRQCKPIDGSNPLLDDAIDEAVGEALQRKWESMVNHFADALHATNPNFDRQRFLAACQGE